MPTQARPWWRNCTEEADAEMLAIDALEDRIAPLDKDAVRIRKLIGCFESCHHKAVRHAEIIVAAIGAGQTDKGQGHPHPERLDPREEEYEALIAILSAWCAGGPPSAAVSVGDRTAQEWLASLGERTPLKVWQVEIVIEKLRRFRDRRARWSAAQVELADVPGATDQAEFRERTRQTLIHDMADGRPATISLALALDYLTGCNWNFIENVRVVLGAIGGDLHPAHPLTLHQRNFALNPQLARLRIIAATLRAFCEDRTGREDKDSGILAKLGSKTPVKHWLAASLATTLQLQLPP